MWQRSKYCLNESQKQRAQSGQLGDLRWSRALKNPVPEMSSPPPLHCTALGSAPGSIWKLLFFLRCVSWCPGWSAASLQWLASSVIRDTSSPVFSLLCCCQGHSLSPGEGLCGAMGWKATLGPLRCPASPLRWLWPHHLGTPASFSSTCRWGSRRICTRTCFCFLHFSFAFFFFPRVTMGSRSLGQTAWTLILEPLTLGRLPELSMPPLSHLWNGH